MTIRGGGNPILDMAYVPRFRMGPLPWSFAADAYDCIMVQLAIEPTGYKFVARCSRLDGELPSDCLAPSTGLSQTGSTTQQNDRPDRLPEPPRKRDSHD
jgi:hypothetical protein